MKFVDEYRDGALAQQYANKITEVITRPWTIMEICGGQTHAIVKYGIDQLLPPEINLIHGPGCPVCVTPIERIDRALAIAKLPNVILASFGDMLRVPGTSEDLLSLKATGADIRILYSPLDALKLAAENPQKEIVFLAVGFETTAPATAMAVYQAKKLGLTNFSLLVSHVLVPPAMEAILSSPHSQVQGFLAAGHVCTVMGLEQYPPIAEKYHVPIIITGFEPIDILQGLYLCLTQLEAGQAQVINQYARSVRNEGNAIAKQILETVFTIIPQHWRGIGEISASGLSLATEYRNFDADHKFKPYLSQIPQNEENKTCISGEILQGWKKPAQCPEFGHHCTPEHPLGAPMVSSEGACAAYYHYRNVSPKNT